MENKKRLLPFDLLTIRASDLRPADAIQLPPDLLVYIWKGRQAGGWVGIYPGRGSRFTNPRWHYVYDVLDSEDVEFGEQLGMRDALYDLHESYLAIRIACEQPNDNGNEDVVVAMHELDLVQVQRPVKEAPANAGALPASLPPEGTP